MDEPHSRELVIDLMQEVVAGAAACGYNLPDSLVQGMLKFTETMPAYLPSMYHDFTGQRPMELEAIYQAPLEAAHAAGCVMPKTQMLLQTLKYLSAQ